MIELEDLPELKDAVMIAAFEGWNDAGAAASAVIEHLAEIWDAEVVEPDRLRESLDQPRRGRPSKLDARQGLARHAEGRRDLGQGLPAGVA